MTHFYIHKETGCIYQLEIIPKSIIVEHPITRQAHSIELHNDKCKLVMIPQCSGFDELIFVQKTEKENPYKWLNENFNKAKNNYDIMMESMFNEPKPTTI